MPLTRKQFELGIDTAIENWMKRIEDFLNEHGDEAYSAEELAQAVGAELPHLLKEIPEAPIRMGYYSERDRGWGDFGVALDKLVETDEIERRLIKAQAYYSAAEKQSHSL